MPAGWQPSRQDHNEVVRCALTDLTFWTQYRTHGLDTSRTDIGLGIALGHGLCVKLCGMSFARGVWLRRERDRVLSCTVSVYLT